ncbi:hypothetical protein HRG_001747 [Hirsutella rhossiliensis]|uniref:Uncharacterized protein n=1 Tax=Hirsutella rhossiliensis TaxID=111463 RepID=A0A9P8N1A4_9HYPO|nr:uncharacterized protein HRG_01747 [Hirsutella rhossiliensis]KAH0966338.1 hypothetical protein HRG_01747 [Hirsutella rhossiliensis]
MVTKSTRSSSPASFYADSETQRSATASSPATPCPYIEARQLPRELKDHCQIFLEEAPLRQEASVISSVPLTPSVTRVHKKACRAGNTLALNGITATAEMKLIKDKQLRRSALKEGTQTIGKYRPLTVDNARIRVAKDEYYRRAAQEDKERRIKKKEAREEADFLRRWLRDVRSTVRSSITKTEPDQQKAQGWRHKGDRRAHLNYTEWLAHRYHAFRILCSRGKVQNSFTWP